MTTMEDLTKTQIVLLTLLVSFVTSVATGIITSSLLASAPSGITQTIDRVVEHTIGPVQPSQSTSLVTRTTVVGQDDAVTNAIGLAGAALVHLSNGNLGVVITKDGYVLAPKAVDAAMTATLADGSVLSATQVSVDDEHNLALVKLTLDLKHQSLASLVYASSDPRLGQGVTAFGTSGNSVAIGHIAVIDAGAGTISTDIGPDAISVGSPLVNFRGELVGLKTGASIIGLSTLKKLK